MDSEETDDAHNKEGAGGDVAPGELPAEEQVPPLAVDEIDSARFAVPVAEVESYRPFVNSSHNYVRANLAYRLFWLFAFTAAAGILGNAFLHEAEAAQLNTWLEKLLPAELGVLGAAVGFYFGSARP